MLDAVRVPEATTRLKQYPHEMSGGMRQRIMIATALLCRPALLIAYEPTTALDVTVQAQILQLMQELQRDLGTALLLITHDMGVVASVCDRVLVMRDGQRRAVRQQAFDTANLIVSAAAKADVKDTDAFREALRAADFVSTRGDFKFGSNQHPIQDFYVREVIKDGDVFTNKIIGVALEDRQDVYAAECKL